MITTTVAHWRYCDDDGRRPRSLREREREAWSRGAEEPEFPVEPMTRPPRQAWQATHCRVRVRVSACVCAVCMHGRGVPV
jgi:hypothetical protein